ncbi:MAG: SufS family cysteine desulfurase [Candidatus Levybacteria bacterium]|nr:SufS family cysteine desulfurase [Candidatus Levybacteria bacterium]
MRSYKNDFPIFQKNKKFVYLDSAATSQKPKIVLDAIQEYYATYNANVRRGLYPIAEKATKKVEKVREQVARFINAKDPSEIIFVRNATEAINLAAYSFASHNIAKGDSVVTTIMEHHSNFVPWQQLAIQKNADFVVLDISEDGFLDLDLKIKKAKILTLTHVSNVLGTINQIKDIIKQAKAINPQIKVLVDAAQSIPHMKVDVQNLDCDFLAFSGHKMMAATGIGVLYGKRELLKQMRPFLYGGEMIKEVSIAKTTFTDIPYKFEAGTPDIAGIVSFGAAIEYLKSTGIETIQKHENRLIAYSLSRMKEIEGLTIYGPKDIEKRSGVVSFNLNGIHAHDVAQVLGDMDICIRSGHHCAMPLHKRLGITASARVSFYIYNNEEDVDKLIESIKKVKKIFKYG